jgi:hypothetical protein
MEDDDIDAELNARRLAGKWEVTSSSGGRQYDFEWNPGQWSITSDQDIGAAPAGKVKSVDPKKPSSALAEGTWKVTDKLYVNWNSGRTEQWDLPLRVVGQRGTAGAEQFTAKRLSRPAHLGTLQG